MKILNVISSVNPEHGGLIETIRLMERPICSWGHEWHVASLDAPDMPWVKTCPVPVHALGPAYSAYAYSPHFTRRLARLVPRYDIIAIHGLWQYHTIGTWRALRRAARRRAPRPYVIYTQGMLDPYFKRNFPLKHLKKLLFWPWAEYRVLRDAGAVCFTGESEKLLARESFRFYRARERIVGLGTEAPSENAEVAREAFLERFPALRGRRFLLFLSRIHPKKGLDLLIEAFCSCPDVPEDVLLVIAGPDANNWRPELEKYVSPAMRERIVWTDMIAGDVKWGAFHAAQAFVLPSHQENFGIAVAEALARRVPVLISDQVNIWREIEADGAGLIARDTLEGTRSLLSRWFALTPDAHQEMRERAAPCFERHFLIDAAARHLIECLEETRVRN